MSTYNTYRFVFADEQQFLDVLRDSIPQLYVEPVLDEEGVEVEPATHRERVVTPIRETLTVVRNHGTPQEEIVRVEHGAVTGTRVAELHVHGEGLQRHQRDAQGELMYTTETIDGEEVQVAVMETLAGYHVDVRTNVAPETSPQLQALAAYAVNPTHPAKQYAGELAA